MLSIARRFADAGTSDYRQPGPGGGGGAGATPILRGFYRWGSGDCINPVPNHPICTCMSLGYNS